MTLDRERLAHSLPLEHYAESAVVAVADRQQDRSIFRHNKPDGFWVSVRGDDDWPSWCRSEQFLLNRLHVRHDITLSDSANILLIDDLDKFDRFNDEFTVPGSRPWDTGIDWRRVATLYDGIIIAPYQWHRRLSDRAGWYYGWDCASGCIWNARAIASISACEAMLAANPGDEG